MANIVGHHDRSIKDMIIKKYVHCTFAMGKTLSCFQKDLLKYVRQFVVRQFEIDITCDRTLLSTTTFGNRTYIYISDCV